MKAQTYYFVVFGVGLLLFMCSACVEMEHSFWILGILPVPKMVTPYQSARAVEKEDSSTSKHSSVRREISKHFRWNDPDAEKKWEEIIQASERVSTAPRIGTVNAIQSEGLLESFGMRYMPNAYAKYQEDRQKALEIEQIVRETFPQGKTTGGNAREMFEKVRKRLAELVAQMFRSHDELCFFMLFHQAGIFSDDLLAKYDSRPISVSLETEGTEWPDDTPSACLPLPQEDATFVAKYLPEFFAGYQRLGDLFDEGARQYAELRRTALELDAARGRSELMMLKGRLEELKTTLLSCQKDISGLRLGHAIGEYTATNLADLDQVYAVIIQKYAREMGLKAYVSRVAMHLFVPLPGGVSMEMVWCPPGTFMMGSPENEGDADETQHRVTLTKGFWMAKTEVTQEQWISVMGENPARNKNEKLPVENMFWNDCQEFCRKIGMALPTEAEWEYACRAGATGAYGGTGKLEDMGWYSRNSGSTHQVGQKLPNAWGLYDMHGNVWEWCQDWYGDYPNKMVTDPEGADSGNSRVMRGGSYEDNWGCRSASRSGHSPGLADKGIGFRPVARQD